MLFLPLPSTSELIICHYAVLVNFLSSFFTGFIRKSSPSPYRFAPPQVSPAAVAYIRSWRLALAVSAVLPCIAITGGVMNKFISQYMQYVFWPPITS
jgi:ATP-binding cassette subfamily B (MDR/TAP) protein 1